MTEFGTGIGLGHITRIKVIETYLKKNNVTTKIILYERRETYGTDQSSWVNNLSWLDSVKKFNTVIVDSYLASDDFFQKIRDKFQKIVVIDDYNRISYPVDLLINPNVFFDKIDYSNQIAKCVGGMDFVLLREIFWNKRFELLSVRPKSILVSLGGSDYRDLYPLIASLADHYKEMTFICPERRSFDILKSMSPLVSVKGLLNESEIFDAYLSSEVVISGCGQSLHELFQLKKKTIGILIDKDQKYNQEYYLSNGFLVYKNIWSDEDLILNIRNQIEELFFCSAPNYLSEFDPLLNLKKYFDLLVESDK
ncbi:glycosyl transferase family 1 [Leptospira kanakyensis]|uniref:glycosyl transferase family 1 n=1 Tax=Leptospira kanakyensis TaxID=2484968 RepID=UPI00223E4EB4|nr:glycosyl transferase family 1 [Leptospira kanakyensis]MCW7482137.1 glycosyl transferase family 1 [Leptospira kanakyensis]